MADNLWGVAFELTDKILNHTFRLIDSVISNLWDNFQSTEQFDENV